jgi:hypothetical protein
LKIADRASGVVVVVNGELASIIQCTLNIGGGDEAFLEAGIPSHSRPAVSLVDFNDQQLFTFV